MVDSAWVGAEARAAAPVVQIAPGLRSTNPSRFNRPKRERARLTALQLSRIADMFEVIGAATEAEQIRRSLASVEKIRADTAAAHSTVNTARADLVGRISRGEILPTDAAVEFDRLEKQTLNEPLAKELANDGRRAAIADITWELVTRGDTLLTDLLDPAIVRAAHFIRESAPTVAGVGSDAEAVRAGPKVAHAWSEILGAIEVIESAWSLALALRLGGVVHTLPSPTPSRELWEWRHVDVLTRYPVRGVPAWIEAVQAGAEPGALTAAEVIDTYFTEPPHEPA